MTIYLSEHIDPGAEQLLREKAVVVDNFDRASEIDGIILRNIPVTAELMDRTKNLKVIAKHGVGCNTIDLEAAKARDIQVIYTPAANADSVAELIVGLFLLLARKLYEANVGCRAGLYAAIAPRPLTGMELGGKTLGTIGMGSIATRTAKILRGGFGVKALGYDPFCTARQAEERGFEQVETVEELLERADLVSVNVPLLDSTRNLLSGEMFDHFKPGALLVNAARGGIVNEDDLYEALTSGKLKAAACDAFSVEPPTGENRLLSLPNFSATPHIGGATDECLTRVGMEIVTETLNVLAGKKPIHPVC